MTTLPRRVPYARALCIRIFLVLALCTVAQLLSGCASLITARPPPTELFQDQLFKPSTAMIDTSRIFAVDDAMRDYLHHEITGAKKGADARQTLFNALYRRDQLKLEYDSVITRTASETFAARSGNCLSLAIMTAALARELNFAVQFQLVDVGEVWSRAGSLYFSSNHVNLVLDRKRIDTSNGYALNVEQPLVVDFIPAPPQPPPFRRRSSSVDEKRIHVSITDRHRHDRQDAYYGDSSRECERESSWSSRDSERERDRE